LVAPGVVLNKDGSFQRTARFRGPDLDSATPAELVASTARLNNALRRLGSGWAIFVEAQRRPALDLSRQRLSRSCFGAGRAERKAQFEEEGAHFESGYFLTFLWMPPAEDAARAETWLYEGRENPASIRASCCAASSTAPTACWRLVDGFMPEVFWLDDSETLTYLHSTASRPTAIASACPKRRCTSTRCWPISR
jgi:type IV secretory pathway VirB4 component